MEGHHSRKDTFYFADRADQSFTIFVTLHQSCNILCIELWRCIQKCSLCTANRQIIVIFFEKCEEINKFDEILLMKSIRFDFNHLFISFLWWSTQLLCHLRYWRWNFRFSQTIIKFERSILAEFWFFFQQLQITLVFQQFRNKIKWTSWRRWFRKLFIHYTIYSDKENHLFRLFRREVEVEQFLMPYYIETSHLVMRVIWNGQNQLRSNEIVKFANMKIQQNWSWKMRRYSWGCYENDNDFWSQNFCG